MVGKLNPAIDSGGWVGLGWVKASSGRLPTVRAAFPAGPDWAAIPGCPVTGPTGLLTAPKPRGGARGREMPPCLCVCALVCLRGGGGVAVAHLPSTQGEGCRLGPWPAPANPPSRPPTHIRQKFLRGNTKLTKEAGNSIAFGKAPRRGERDNHS